MVQAARLHESEQASRLLYATNGDALMTARFPPTRRDVLRHTALGFGSLALADLIHAADQGANAARSPQPPESA